MSGLDVQAPRTLQNAQAPRTLQNAQTPKILQNIPPSPALTGKPGPVQDDNQSAGDLNAVGNWFSEMNQSLQEASPDVTKILESPNAVVLGSGSVILRGSPAARMTDGVSRTDSAEQTPNASSAERSRFSWETEEGIPPQGQKREDTVDPGSVNPSPDADYSGMTREEMKAELDTREKSLTQTNALLGILDQLDPPNN
jgi:hypothetical protein